MIDLEKLIRVVAWFNKTGDDFLVDKEDITHLNSTFLIELLHIDVGNDIEMVMGDYRIADTNVLKLQPYIQHKIDTDKFDYFITTCART